jgi:hypothetical protein
MFTGRAVATSESGMSDRLMTTRTEFPEHLTSVSYFRHFRIWTLVSHYLSLTIQLTDLCMC